MDLNKREEAMVKAFRAIDEIPENVILWYQAGLNASADKVKDVDAEQANISNVKAKDAGIAFNAFIKLGELR